MLSKPLSHTFQIANLFATLLVVAIHFNTKQHMDLNAQIPLNYFIQEYITNGIARIAVPFFAFAAGFFFYLKYSSFADYSTNLSKRIRTLIIPYLLGSALIFISEYLYLGVFKNEVFIITPLIILKNIILSPLPVQFWFLRDLIFLILVSPIIWLFCRYLKSLFILILFTLWMLDIEFLPTLADRHIITIETLSFFALGCFFSSTSEKIELVIKQISKQHIIFLLIIYCTLIAVRIYISPFFTDGPHSQNEMLPLLIQNTHILLGIFLLLCISYRSSSKTLFLLSSYTFFVFIYHGISLNRVVVKLSDFWIIDAYKFYLTFPLSVLLTFLCAILLEKFYPLLYNTLTGGRNTNKVLSRETNN